MTDRITEGRVTVEGGEIWFGVHGDPGSGRTPLLVVHGGPGMSHDYLIALSDLADTRAVVFYDQLDAGRSDCPNDPANWHVERFLREIDDVRGALGLDRVCLFGNSWGGTLAAAYAAARPVGLERLILSSPLIQTERWITDNMAHRAALPDEVLRVMERCEAQDQMDSQAYADAVEVFYRRHLCRLDPWPDAVLRTFELINAACYAAMWGPNEFTCTGILRGYDGAHALPDIRVPTLVTCGAFDEATPESTRVFAEMIPNAAFEVFAASSHMAFVEERAAYIARMRNFLEG